MALAIEATAERSGLGTDGSHFHTSHVDVGGEGGLYTCGTLSHEVGQFLQVGSSANLVNAVHLFQCSGNGIDIGDTQVANLQGGRTVVTEVETNLATHLAEAPVCSKCLGHLHNLLFPLRHSRCATEIDGISTTPGREEELQLVANLLISCVLKNDVLVVLCQCGFQRESSAEGVTSDTLYHILILCGFCDFDIVLVALVVVQLQGHILRIGCLRGKQSNSCKHWCTCEPTHESL